MSPDNQRIAIAECCGWTEVQYSTMLLRGRHRPGDGYGAPVPFYLTDLNAMHEVERAMPSEQRNRYLLRLGGVCCAQLGSEHAQRFFLTTATAGQRAEAFLRTMGKWVEELKT